MSGPQHTGFWGVTGVGKSYEVKRRLSVLPSGHSRVVVISPVDEWSSTSPERKGPMKDAMTLAEFKRDPMKLFEPHLALSLYGFDPLRPEQAAAAVKLVARLQSRFKTETGKTPRPFLLVLDECGSYAKHVADVLQGLATLGGQHLGVTLWVVSQRPALVPITVRSQLKELVLWHMSEPADVEAASERVRDPELAGRLAALPGSFTTPDAGPYFIEISTSSAAAVKQPRKSTAKADPPSTHPISPPANPKQKEATQ